MTRNTFWKQGLAALLFAGQLCAGARAKNPDRVSVKTPDRFAEQTNAPGTTTDAAVEKWWATLNDAELTKLIDRGIESNLDLKAAGQRLLEARASRRITRGDLLPSIESSNSFRQIRGGFEDGNIHLGNLPPGGGIFVSPFETNIFQLGFDASWEIDLFGGKRHALQAATAEVASAEEARRDALVSLSGEIARNYMELRGAQRRLALTKQNIALQQDSLHLTQVRVDAGLGAQLDVERQQEQLASSEALVPSLQKEISLSIHALSVLLAQPPSALQQELEGEGQLPPNPPTVPVGLPGDLLTRRPDLRQSRAQLIAAAARVGAAKADLFPKIVVTGLAGRQATDLSGFTIGAGNFFAVGPGITLPIFEAGKIRANIAVKKQQYEEAVTEYQKAVLTALRESEDSLAGYGREQERREKLSAAVQASQQATQMATELYRRGLTDFISVLDAQRDQLANEDALVQSNTAVLTDLIALYKSLGGGWNTTAPGR
ncbi:MAG: efflux transporter outer membrane subunit [Acidobacteriaceae bacterium]|nr:efflux transporter outer membrane subunit [Acidobacteriaceae bacterium]